MVNALKRYTDPHRPQRFVFLESIWPRRHCFLHCLQCAIVSTLEVPRIAVKVVSNIHAKTSALQRRYIFPGIVLATQRSAAPCCVR